MAHKTDSGQFVDKQLAYKKIEGNPLLDDMQIRLLGMSDLEVAVLSLDSAKGMLNFLDSQFCGNLFSIFNQDLPSHDFRQIVHRQAQLDLRFIIKAF